MSQHSKKAQPRLHVPFKTQTEGFEHPELKKSWRQRRKVKPNRREKRRLDKQLKKARKIAHASKQPASELCAKVNKARGRKKINFQDLIAQSKLDEASVSEKTAKNIKKVDVTDENLMEKNPKQEEMTKLQKIHEKLRVDIEQDDMEIRQLSKKLKLNKRKNKSLPQSFVDEGLSYVLDFQSSSNQADESDQEDFNNKVKNPAPENSDEEAPEELPVLSKGKRRNEKSSDHNNKDPASKHSNVKRVRFEKTDENKESDEENESENYSFEEDSEESGSENEPELTEDIYGRFRDKKGNIIQAEKEEKLDYDEDEEKLQTLKKTFRSLINRMSETNVHSVVNKVAESFTSQSRTSVKKCLTDAIVNSVVRTEKIPDRLILEQCLLLAILHSRVSSEITAYFVEELSAKMKIFEYQLNQNELGQMDKSTDNVALILAYLYALKVIQAKLLFDILKLLASNLNEKSVELILIILQSVGYFLRKECPLDLKTFIENATINSASIQENQTINKSRLTFMLDTLNLIKNNNFTKLANFNQDLTEHFVKTLRGVFPGKQLEAPLPMTLEDLWSVKEKGRWWIVGSAVVVKHKSPIVKENFRQISDKKDVESSVFGEKFIKLAKKNGMNTETRRNVFCIIISSEDYLDAFEKLHRLALKGQQEREIIHIALSCILKEKSYNPFYTFLIQRFCQDQPRFVLTTQFAIWDKLKVLDSLSAKSIDNFAFCVAHLLGNKVLPLTILKVIDFGTLPKRTKYFCDKMFEKLLVDVCDENLKSIFANCMSQKEAKRNESMLEGIKNFLHHSLQLCNENNPQRKVIEKKMDVLDSFLYYQVGGSLL